MEITINREIGKLGLPRHLVLGMDPGIASCGFALIDTANHEILDLGVRLFDSPTHPKTGQSLAVIRRGFRSTRRNIDRTSALEALSPNPLAYGLIPQDATKEYFHTTKGDKQPLKLRVDGLDRLLNDREWALVLYSLCKRVDTSPTEKAIRTNQAKAARFYPPCGQQGSNCGDLVPYRWRMARSAASKSQSRRQLRQVCNARPAYRRNSYPI